MVTMDILCTLRVRVTRTTFLDICSFLDAGILFVNDPHRPGGLFLFIIKVGLFYADHDVDLKEAYTGDNDCWCNQEETRGLAHVNLKSFVVCSALI